MSVGSARGVDRVRSISSKCTEWTGEIRELTLWAAVGKVPGDRDIQGSLQEQERFRFQGQAGKGKPQQHVSQGLAVGQPYTEAVLDFLGATRMGEIKAGVIRR